MIPAPEPSLRPLRVPFVGRCRSAAVSASASSAGRCGSFCGFLLPCGCALSRVPSVVALVVCERPWRARLRFSRPEAAERTGTGSAAGATRATRPPSPYVHVGADVVAQRDTHAAKNRLAHM